MTKKHNVVEKFKLFIKRIEFYVWIWSFRDLLSKEDKIQVSNPISPINNMNYIGNVYIQKQ